MSSLEKCLLSSFTHFLIGLFVFLEWSHVSSLHILEIKPLSYISLANMFSHRVGWFPFHFDDVFFSCAEAFQFDIVPFVYFLISLALGDISAKILLCGISEIFLPMFSSRTFMVSRLIFKSCIHLELILVYGVSWWLSFIFSACSCPDLPTTFAEEITFTPFYASVPFVKY